MLTAGDLGHPLFTVSSTATAALARDGTVREVNRAWIALLGKRWPGRRLAEGAPPEDQAALTSALARLSDGETPQFPIHLLADEGIVRRLTCELCAGPGSSYVFCTAREFPAQPGPDAAKLSAAVDRVKRSEAEFRKLLEHVPDGVVVLRDSQFVYANPAAARILGYDAPVELIGVHYSAIVRPEELPHSVERVKRMAAGELPSRNERPMVRRDGSTVYAETMGFATEFDGAPATVVIAHDLTGEKLMHAKIRQADRLVSLGLLAAGVAHELNNPLAYVLLSLSQVRRWLKESLDKPDTNRLKSAVELVEQSLEGTERMRLILGDLRAFSRQDDLQSSHLDVCAVLDAVIPMAEHLIRPRATLTRDYEPVPLIRANEARLGQVFVNLLANAAQAIPEGSPRAHDIRVAVRAEGASKILIRVSDTGVGMPPEVLERAFEPFFTTKSADAGTGLGLSVCMGIVQGLGGTIAAQSEAGRGSSFTVTLPVYEQLTAEPQLPAHAPSRVRVLVVDDEPNIARRLADILADQEVVVVTSGREAIARLREERFDAVFCDLMMPDVSGVQVFEDLTRRDAGLASRLIFMTAGAFTPNARALLDRVPNPRLDKPFDEDQVRKLLGLVTAHRRQPSSPSS